MKSIVKGKIVDKIYSVDCEYSQIKDVNGKSDLLRKPKLKVEEKVTYENICEFEGNYVSNKYPLSFTRNNFSNTFEAVGLINISEDESVKIVKTTFRADLNEQHIFTNKVLKENEVYKEFSKSSLKSFLKDWNKQEIEKDEKLLAYCHLHNLVVEDTDVDELRKVVYGNDTKLTVAKGRNGCSTNMYFDKNCITNAYEYLMKNQ